MGDNALQGALLLAFAVALDRGERNRRRRAQRAAGRSSAIRSATTRPASLALRVAPISETRDTAKVLAEFARGDGAREQLTYAMVYERGEWRIDDIAYAMLDGESHTLRGDAGRELAQTIASGPP